MILIAASIFPVMLQCTVMEIIPLRGETRDVRMMFADRGLTFEPALAERLGVSRADGSWDGQQWNLEAKPPAGGKFEAVFMPHDTDEGRFGLDWRRSGAAKPGAESGLLSSGIADCRATNMPKEGQSK
nr:hypothetical protein [uncultured Sphingomonas sp.]